MKYANAGDVLRLTGLSADQLREWTVRRGLIEPDKKPAGPGSRTGFTWQTVLVLRIAIVLKKSFGVELQGQREFFRQLAQRLAGTSFPALRDMVLIIGAGGVFRLSDRGSTKIAGDCVVIDLEPHLDVLSTEFGVLEPAKQLALFPARAVS